MLSSYIYIYLYIQSRSLSGRHVSTGFLDPVLGAMMKQVCWHSRHAWQELLWKKPPLRTSTWQALPFMTLYGNLQCGRAKSEARPDGESTRGKAKFGKRHGSRKWEEENSSTRRRHRGKGRKRQQTPSPPYNVPHTRLGIRRAGCSLLLCISQTPEMHPRPFFGGFWHPQWSFARVFPHPQGNPQASARALADM